MHPALSPGPSPPRRCPRLFTLLQVLMSPGDQCFRGHGRRSGERRRKSVRGCIVSQDLSVLNLVIVKKGEAELPGLTDEEKPRQRGPKRASKIRKMFNLTKEDDVRHYVKIYGKKVEKVSRGRGRDRLAGWVRAWGKGKGRRRGWSWGGPWSVAALQSRCCCGGDLLGSGGTRQIDCGVMRPGAPSCRCPRQAPP
jgi:hypothetical protein